VKKYKEKYSGAMILAEKSIQELKKSRKWVILQDFKKRFSSISEN
jgi:hypothetical protein